MKKHLTWHLLISTLTILKTKLKTKLMQNLQVLPQLSFGEAIKTCFSKYVTFTGRARRSEFWYFYLFYFIVYVVAAVIDAIMTSSSDDPTLVFKSIVCLAFFLPSLAVFMRRMHDIGKSGWWWLLGIIPIIGTIILIVWTCKDSSADENQYGPSPKYVSNTQDA